MLPASAVPALIGHFPTGDAGDEAREIGGFGGHGLHGESIAQHGLHQIVSIVEETTAPQVSSQRRPSRWLRDVLAQGAVSLCGQPEVDSINTISEGGSLPKYSSSAASMRRSSASVSFDH